MKNNRQKENYGSLSGRLALCLAGGSYVLSAIVSWFNATGETVLDAGTETITIAHWQLEDGFREGIDDAIRQFKNLKARQGVKVKVNQTTVPYRGYPQWFTTQLISGNPADLIELTGSSQIHNQYFVPLSSYISQPNPFNSGTPLEGIPWKDTFVDGMNSGLDTNYAEYFGVGTFFHVTRIFVNKELLRQATGDDSLPRTFDEWLEDCQLLREYGEKTGTPIIPIGVRGFDKSTVTALLIKYFSQLNGNLNDSEKFCAPTVNSYELFEALASRKLDRERLFSAVDLTVKLGRNFCEGFTATDLEQTKFLFFSGNVGFFPEGTWNGWSIVNNSPFEVDVVTVPSIGPGNSCYKYFTGIPSETGASLGGKFGISKRSANFELALEFLQFLTSYRINQLTMMQYCKWPPAVVQSDYTSLLEKFKPEENSGMLTVYPPFYLEKKSRIKSMEEIERLIVEDSDDPGKDFAKYFFSNISLLKEEAEETNKDRTRQLFDIAVQSSEIGAGLLDPDLAEDSRERLKLRQAMNLENVVRHHRTSFLIRTGLAALKKLEVQNKR